jgi:hypothetical protein
MIDSAATVSRKPMLANMLNTPVAELTTRDKIDAGEDFVDAGTLSRIRSDTRK